MGLVTVTSAGLRPLPLSLLSQSIPMLSRGELEDVIERLIDELDRRDDDADLENACDLEDDFELSPHGAGFGRMEGVGCCISDPGGRCDEDDFNTGFIHGFRRGPGCLISDAGEFSL